MSTDSSFSKDCTNKVSEKIAERLAEQFFGSNPITNGIAATTAKYTVANDIHEAIVEPTICMIVEYSEYFYSYVVGLFSTTVHPKPMTCDIALNHAENPSGAFRDICHIQGMPNCPSLVSHTESLACPQSFME